MCKNDLLFWFETMASVWDEAEWDENYEWEETEWDEIDKWEETEWDEKEEQCSIGLESDVAGFFYKCALLPTTFHLLLRWNGDA